MKNVSSLMRPKGGTFLWSPLQFFFQNYFTVRLRPNCIRVDPSTTRLNFIFFFFIFLKKRTKNPKKGNHSVRSAISSSIFYGPLISQCQMMQTAAHMSIAFAFLEYFFFSFFSYLLHILWFSSDSRTPPESCKT